MRNFNFNTLFITGFSVAMFATPIANAGANPITYVPIIGNNQTIPATAFKEFLKITSDNRVAKTFGFPDEIISAKDANDELQGMVWVYKDLVASEKGTLDARFLIVDGNVQMYSLAKSS